jgi:predicted transcriptional regulator
MKLEVLRNLLQCEVLTGADALDTEIDTAVASDAMSVVLASPHPRALLITGLTNIQSVRTAQVSFLPAIMYVRGSRPTEATVKLAREKKMVLLSTHLGMFDCCGILYSHGIKGGV